jgi:hypothetical protein
LAGIPGLRERFKPPFYDPNLTAKQLWSKIEFGNLDDPLNILPLYCMAEGRFRQVTHQIPPGCPAMKVGNLIGMAPVKLSLEEIGKEPVIPEPLSVVVQRHKEQILSFQAFKHGLAASTPADGITQRTAQAIQDAGLKQEPSDIFGQMGKHIFTQVIGDEAMPATHDELIRRLAVTSEG